MAAISPRSCAPPTCGRPRPARGGGQPGLYVPAEALAHRRPQAVHIGLPGYGNSIIYLIHNVALVMYIGAADVMATAHLIMERDYNQYQFQTYLVLAVIYSLLCLVVAYRARLRAAFADVFHESRAREVSMMASV